MTTDTQVEEIEAIPVEIDDIVFNEIYIPHLENETRRQIFFGGSSSGKSVFLAQRTIIDLLDGGRNYLIVRAVGKSIKKSVFAEVVGVIENWGLTSVFHIHKTDLTITCDNGYQALFSGLDDVEKLKSIRPKQGVITDIWVEEATEVKRDALKALDKRLRGIDAYSDIETPPKRTTLSFNPILKSHHIYEDYFKDIMWIEDQTEYYSEELTITKTWYIHNDFLTEEDRDDLENEDDQYFFDVYTLGNWGVLGDVIFTNWSVEDFSDIAGSFDNHRDGIDFGYASNPVCYLNTHLDEKKKKIYIISEFYGLETSDKELANEIKSIVERRRVECDEAEPKSIAALKKLGIKAHGAKKGADSVKFGIKWLKGYEIIISPDCINFKNNIEQYQWKKDRWGQAMDVPVKKNDHGIDALRYALSNDMREKKTRKPITVRAKR